MRKDRRHVTDALDDSMNSIQDILTGRRPHPIIADFVATLGHAGDKVMKASDFRASLNIPILPGDASITETYTSQIHQRVMRTNLPPLLGHDPFLFTTGAGAVLLQLVVLRTYLERPPSDDLTIYKLVRGAYIPGDPSSSPLPRIIRRLTVPEEAFATVKGLGPKAEVEDIQNIRGIALEGFIKRTKNLECRFDRPLAYVVQDGSTGFIWPPSEDEGLTGCLRDGGPAERAPPGSAKPKVRARPLKRPRKPIEAGSSPEGQHEPTLVVTPPPAVTSTSSINGVEDSGPGSSTLAAAGVGESGLRKSKRVKKAR